MRDQIHASAFRRDMQSTQPESSVRSSRRGTLNDSENQWMEDIEADNDLQMCSGCGRRFERRAALHSHSQLCTKRIALCNTIKENNSKQVQEEKQDKGNKQTKAVKNNEKDSLKGAVRRKPLIIRKKVGNLKTNLEKKQSEDVDSGFSENVEKADLKKPDNTKSDEIKASDIQSDANIDIKGDSEISTPENKDKLKANVYFPSMNRDDVLDIIGVTNSKETENSPVKDENKIIDTPASVEVPKSLRNDISESKKTEVVVAAGISQQDKKMLTNEDHIYCIPDNTDFKKRTTLEIQKINLELKNTIKEIMSVYENDNILNSHENIFSDRIENVELKRKRLLDDVNSDTCPKKLNQQVVQTSASDEITVCQTKQILVNCGSSGSEETQNSPNPKNKEAALDIPENSESVGKSCQPNSDIITDVAQSLDENVTSNQKQETDLVKFPQSPQVMEVEVSTDVTNSEKSPEKIQEDNSETKYSQAVVNCKPCQLEEFEDTKTSKDMEAASVTDPGLRKMVMEVIFGGEINLPVMQVHITQESAASDAPTSAPVPSKAPAPTPVTRPVRTVRRTLLPDEFCYNFTKCNNKSTKDDVELSRFGQRPLKVYSGKVKKTHNNK